MTTNQGRVSELEAMKTLLEEFKVVSEPISPAPYDLVIEREEYLERVQVKTGLVKQGKIVAKLNKVGYNSNGQQTSYYTEDEVDFFCIVDNESNKVFLVPFEEAPRTEISLRLDSDFQPNGSKVRMAEDYVL
jgi:hypothetical protein